METSQKRQVLISGASIAGLSTAWWLNNSGYQVTLVELAGEPRTTGGAVDFRDNAVEAVRRMGIYEQLKSNRLSVEKIEFKNAGDLTEGSIALQEEGSAPAGDEIEIERDKFVAIMMNTLHSQVEFMFNNRITALDQTMEVIKATFSDGTVRGFDLVIGCDGVHSGVRKIWFGEESEYAHFLGAYSALVIVDKLLIRQKTMQVYNVPDKAVMLNAYNGKTDIIFCFNSETEIAYDYRDAARQRRIITGKFTGEGWRTPELLAEMEHSGNFYFDKFCQIKMPAWTKGRVALVGDAGYSASPAAGMGASLSVAGAAALADALQKHAGDFEKAFAEYDKSFRAFTDEVQATAAVNVKSFIPRTEEAIKERNGRGSPF